MMISQLSTILASAPSWGRSFRQNVNILSVTLAVSLLMCWGSKLVSEEVESKPSAIGLAQAKELVALMAMEQQAREVVEATYVSSLAPIANQVEKMPKGVQQAMATGMAEGRAILEKKADWSLIQGDIAVAYAGAFTTEELTALLAFYRTPLGRRLSEQAPALIKAALVSSQREVTLLQGELQQVMMKRLNAAIAKEQGGAEEGGDPQSEKGIEVGKSFPALAGTTTAGAPFSLAQWKGKVVLVDFWATWCGPCLGELPEVIAAYEKYHAQGFEIIGVSLDQDLDALAEMVKTKKMPWPQLCEGKGWQSSYATAFAIRGIPAPFLLGKDGVLVAKGEDIRGEGLDPAIAAALAAGTP